ncbi:hypothetical protein P3T21_006690 [Paraburkholderia sp. GAS334]
MKQRRRIYYTDSQKALMWERWQKGESLQKIAQLFDRNHSSVQGILAETGGIRPAPRHRSRLALTLTEREEISRALVAGRSIRSIAMQLERAIAFVQLAAKPAGIDVRGLKVNIREHDSSRSQPKAASTKESTSASVEAVTFSLYWSPMA